MQQIVIEKPYRFIPPYRGTFWSSVAQRLNLHGRYLRRNEAVASYECRGVERLQQSLAAGHGILLTPNHPRTADPIVLGWLAREAGCHMYAMASWHLFHQHWFHAWAIRMSGGFSVYREGVDRAAINAAIEILESAERPLVIFPEGATTRTNDQLQALLEGVSFIARAAAKRRMRHEQRRVVVHPVALKYLFRGPLEEVVDRVLSGIERRITWWPQRHLSLVQRVVKVGTALLALKELQFLGQTQSGTLHERQIDLVHQLLEPLEQRWLGRPQQGAISPRVKALRMQILPDMVRGQVSPAERAQRWEQLNNIYLAQQIACYPPDYLDSRRSVDRILEIAERFEEDLTHAPSVHGPLHVVIQVGEPIEVDTRRERRGEPDPLIATLEARLQAMLDQLALESPEYPLPSPP